MDKTFIEMNGRGRVEARYINFHLCVFFSSAILEDNHHL